MDLQTHEASFGNCWVGFNIVESKHIVYPDPDPRPLATDDAGIPVVGPNRGCELGRVKIGPEKGAATAFVVEFAPQSGRAVCLVAYHFSAIFSSLATELNAAIGAAIYQPSFKPQFEITELAIGA